MLGKNKMDVKQMQAATEIRTQERAVKMAHHLIQTNWGN